jgi:hypothetical protein
VFGDIQAGFIYFDDDTNDVFDTRLWTCRPFNIAMADELVHMVDVDFPTEIGGLAIIADNTK